MEGFECPTGLEKGARVTIDGCNCKNKTATKIAVSKGKKKGDKKSQLSFLQNFNLKSPPFVRAFFMHRQLISFLSL